MAAGAFGHAMNYGRDGNYRKQWRIRLGPLSKHWILSKEVDKGILGAIY